MSKQQKKKLIESKKPSKVKDPFELTKYRYAIYKAVKSIQLGEEFGNMVIPRGENIFMPVRLEAGDRKFISTLEKILKPISPNSKIKGRNVLVIRYGGIGDVLTSLYGIAELKAKFDGDVKVGYITSIKNIPLLQCFPKLVDIVMGPVVSAKTISQFNYISYLDDVVELDPMSSSIPIHDVYARQFGVRVNKDTTKLVSAMNLALSDIPRNGIGIQYRSNAIIRDYDIEKTIELINALNSKYGKPIYLLGPPDDYRFINYIQTKTEGQVIPNGCGLTQKMHLHQTMNLVSRLELVIAPDSSMLHIAGVCETPCIGLFGPFPSQLRLSYYKQAIGIDGQASCSPCFRHFPVDFCRYTNGAGLCLNNISTDIILEQVDKFITSNPKRHQQIQNDQMIS